jgi:hypothetical protein
MANVNVPNIPDIPPTSDQSMYEFLKALKEAVEVLTGRVGGNESLIDYMRTNG